MKEVTHTKIVKTDGKGFPWFSIAMVLLVLGGIALAIGWVDSDKYQPKQPASQEEQIQGVGGLTRFPKSDLSAKSLTSANSLTVSNVTMQPVQASIVSTTTMLARLQNPFTATSTFSSSACSVTTGTSTATVIALYIANTESDSFGTSTNGTALVSKSINSGQTGAVSNAIVDNENVIGGSKWLVFGYDTGTVYVGGNLGDSIAAIQQVGTCSSEFREI